MIKFYDTNLTISDPLEICYDFRKVIHIDRRIIFYIIGQNFICLKSDKYG